MRSVLRAALVFAWAALVWGCQSVSEEALQEVYPVYASEPEATAVATGQFGATPLLLLSRSEAEALVARSQADGVSQSTRGVNAPVWRLVLADGRIGWAPKSTWP